MRLEVEVEDEDEDCEWRELDNGRREKGNEGG